MNKLIKFFDSIFFGVFIMAAGFFGGAGDAFSIQAGAISAIMFIIFDWLDSKYPQEKIDKFLGIE